MNKKENNGEITTIQLTMRTRDRLKKVGHMDDTYDTVLNKLIDEHEESE